MDNNKLKLQLNGRMLSYGENFEELQKQDEDTIRQLKQEGKPIPESIKELLELTRLVDNGDETFTPTKSLADIVDYYLYNGLEITPYFVNKYFRLKNGLEYKSTTKIISRQKSIKKPYM